MRGHFPNHQNLPLKKMPKKFTYDITRSTTCNHRMETAWESKLIRVSPLTEMIDWRFPHQPDPPVARFHFQTVSVYVQAVKQRQLEIESLKHQSTHHVATGGYRKSTHHFSFDEGDQPAPNFREKIEKKTNRSGCSTPVSYSKKSPNAN